RSRSRPPRATPRALPQAVLLAVLRAPLPRTTGSMRATMAGTVHLRPGHVQPVWTGHPWVFVQAIARIEGTPQPGDAVTVLDPRGNFLGRGFYSPGSAIPVRILARERDAALDDAFLHKRVREAAQWRRQVLGLPDAETNGFRLVHAEGDGLPGLVVDAYDD